MHPMKLFKLFNVQNLMIKSQMGKFTLHVYINIYIHFENSDGNDLRSMRTINNTVLRVCK